MKRLIFCILSFAVLLASCVPEEPQYVGRPAVEVKVLEASHTGVTVQINSINTDAVYMLCVKGDSAPEASEVAASGVKVEPGTVTYGHLSPGADYIACVTGSLNGEFSKVETAKFSTMAGVLPEFADITLCPGGGKTNDNPWFTIPYNWTAERFAPHVSYTDGSGEHWLFDAFLAICGVDREGKTYSITGDGSISADKASWEALASYWFDKGGAFDALNTAIVQTESRIGAPPSVRKVVMTLPDPIMLYRFSDKGSSTTYWGALDGVQLDFSKEEDQVRACNWFIDLCREKFEALAPTHLSLAGFYVLSEELVAESSGWNYRYKRWDRILPFVSDHLHAKDQGLYWIPYRGAAGCRLWQNLGIDTAWLQPNWYWDYKGLKPISGSFSLMKQYKMGMELEFEYSMVGGLMSSVPGIKGPDGEGNYVFTADDVPSLRARFRDYMDGYKSAGLYGKYPIALYSGSNAMFQIANSSDPADRAMYLEMCRFITSSSLKKK